jgi:predicted DNA-binding protein YlxM (UPF0122 family)
MGFVDEIVKSTKNFKAPKTTNANELQVFYNSILTKKTMNKVTDYLKISNEANEDAIVAALSESTKVANDRIAELEAELKVFKDALEATKLAEKDAEKVEAELLIENAITDKKITAESKEDWKSLSIINHVAFKNSLNSIPKPITGAVKIMNGVNNAVKLEGKESWTIRDWEKKDSKGLAEIMTNSPLQYQEMYNAFYKKIN